MIDENTTIKFQTRQSIQEIIDLVRSGVPICYAEAESVGLSMSILSAQAVGIAYNGSVYTLDEFMTKFADPLCDRLLYEGIATKRHLWTVYVKGEYVTGDK